MHVDCWIDETKRKKVHFKIQKLFNLTTRCWFLQPTIKAKNTHFKRYLHLKEFVNFSEAFFYLFYHLLNAECFADRNDRLQRSLVNMKRFCTAPWFSNHRFNYALGYDKVGSPRVSFMRGLGKLLHHFWEVLIGFLYQNYKKKVKKK